MADTKITGLATAVAIGTDIIPFVDDPGGGAPVTKKTTFATIPHTILGSIGSNSHAIIDAAIAMLHSGRLTLTTALPVTTADVTAATQIFFTPHRGNVIALWDGASTWVLHEYTELSLYSTDVQNGTFTNGSKVISGLTDARRLAVGMTITAAHMGGTIASINSNTQVTGSANATASETVSTTFKVAASLPVDVFVAYWGDAVVLRQIIWTSGTARATALQYQDGVWVSSGDTTWRYLGTYRTTLTAGQIEDSVTKRFVWNYYNRALRYLYCKEATDHFYNGAVRKWMNADTNNLLEVVVGIAEESLTVSIEAVIKAGADASYYTVRFYADGADAGIGVTGGDLSTYNVQFSGSAAGYPVPVPVIGYHYYQVYELGNHATSEGLAMMMRMQVMM